jgi:hypothetical protein
MKRLPHLLCAMLAVGAAHAAQPVLELASSTGYHERLENRTLVSGGTVVGVQSPAAQTALDPRKLAVYVAPAQDAHDLLCVQVTTSAGHYWSRNAYRLTAAAGWAGLQTQSRYVSALEAVRDPTFAVRAELRKAGAGDDPDEVCTRALRQPPTLLVAGLGAGANRPSPVVVMLNSKGTPARVEVAGPGGAARNAGKCERLRDIATRAYDTRCEVALPMAGPGKYTLLVTLSEPGEDADLQRVYLLLP